MATQTGYDDDLIDRLGINLSTNVKNLRHLNLNRPLTAVQAENLGKAVSVNTTLYSITLLDVGLEDVHILTSLANGFTQSQSLTCLDISYNQLGVEGISLVAELLEKNENLKSLTMISNHLSEEGIEILVKSLEKNPALQFLDLSGSNLQDNGSQWIALCLNNNKNLVNFNLANIRISKFGVQMIAQALSTNHNCCLRSLNLSDNHFGDEGIEYLALGLKENSSLRSLRLKHTYIGMKGATDLSFMLTENNTLAWLDLTYNSIDDEGVAALGEMLKVNTSLQSLILSANDISPIGAQNLSRGLERNVSLQLLDMSYNNIQCLGASAIIIALSAENSDLHHHQHQYQYRYEHHSYHSYHQNHHHFKKINRNSLKFALSGIYLDLSETGMEGFGFDQFSDALKDNNTIHSLDVAHNNFSDVEVMESLSKSLKENHALQCLNLTSTQISEDGIKALVDGLYVNSTLTSLNLQNNAIGNSGARKIGELLSEYNQNKTLRAINLCHNRIGITGASHIVESLKENKVIHSLGLCNKENLDGDSLLLLAKTLMNNHQLTYLKFDDENTTNMMEWQKLALSIEDTTTTNNERLSSENESTSKDSTILDDTTINISVAFDNLIRRNRQQLLQVYDNVHLQFGTKASSYKDSAKRKCFTLDDILYLNQCNILYLARKLSFNSKFSAIHTDRFLDFNYSVLPYDPFHDFLYTFLPTTEDLKVFRILKRIIEKVTTMIVKVIFSRLLFGDNKKVALQNETTAISKQNQQQQQQQEWNLRQR